MTQQSHSYVFSQDKLKHTSIQKFSQVFIETLSLVVKIGNNPDVQQLVNG